MVKELSLFTASFQLQSTLHLHCSIFPFIPLSHSSCSSLSLLSCFLLPSSRFSIPFLSPPPPSLLSTPLSPLLPIFPSLHLPLHHEVKCPHLSNTQSFSACCMIWSSSFKALCPSWWCFSNLVWMAELDRHSYSTAHHGTTTTTTTTTITT